MAEFEIPPAKATLDIYRETAGQPDHYELQKLSGWLTEEMTFVLTSYDLARPGELNFLAEHEVEFLGVLHQDGIDYGFFGIGKKGSFFWDVIEQRRYPGVRVLVDKWLTKHTFPAALETMIETQKEVRRSAGERIL